MRAGCALRELQITGGRSVRIPRQNSGSAVNFGYGGSPGAVRRCKTPCRTDRQGALHNSVIDYQLAMLDHASVKPLSRLNI